MAKAKAKQTKQKAKDKKPVKAAKEVAKKAEATPAWLHKAMAIPPRRKGRPPGTKNRPKEVPEIQVRKGTRRMAISKDYPVYDPEKDPDLKAKDEALVTPAPAKPKGTPLVAEAEPEVEPLFDEVAAGEAIPPENAQAFIAGTLGGGGDQHVDAKRILDRMANEANWIITKGPDDTPAGMAIKARKDAQAKAKKEAEDAKAKDAKGAKKDKDDDAKRYKA